MFADLSIGRVTTSDLVTLPTAVQGARPSERASRDRSDIGAENAIVVLLVEQNGRVIFEAGPHPNWPWLSLPTREKLHAIWIHRHEINRHHYLVERAASGGD